MEGTVCVAGMRGVMVRVEMMLIVGSADVVNCRR